MVCTVIQMVRKSGLGKSVVDEAIGTGNGTNKDFATAYKRVVPGSERLYVASALQTVTDYSMNYTRGDIAMVVAPGDSVLVTGDYLYLARLTEQDLDEALLNAQNFVEGVIWGMDYQWEQFVDLRDITSITLAVGAISDVIMIKIDSEELLEASRSNLPQNPQLDRGDESTDTIVDWSNTGSTATFT